VLAVRILKWFVGFLVTLSVLIALAIVIVPRVFDPNDYRDQITQLVEDKTGREMQLNGDLSVSVFPWLGIRTQGLSLAQPSEIGGQMVQVDTAQLRLKLMPLLSKRVEIDTVVLESPQLRFVTLANGINSLAGLTGDGEDSLEESTEGQDAELALAIVIQGLQLSDGNLEWDDRQNGQRYQVNDLQLNTGNLIGDDLADLSLEAIVLDLSDPAIQAPAINLALQGQANINTDTLMFTTSGLSAEVEQGDNQVTANIADLAFDSAQSALQLQEAQIDLNTAVGEQIQTELDLSIMSFDMNSGQIELSDLAVDGNYGDLPFALSAPSIAANLEAQTASIASTQLQSDDLSMAISNLQVTQFIDNPSVAGSLVVNLFNAAELLSKMDIDFPTSDPQALTQVALSSAFDAGLDHVSLSALDLTVDQTSLQGEFSARDFANLILQFDLALDVINLDRYFAETDESDTSDSESTSSGDALAVPMALFKDLNANGSFRANELVSGGVTLTDIDVQIESSPGMVTVTPRADLYEGELSGSMVYSESNGESQLHVQNKVGLVDLAKLLTDADVTDQLSGFGEVDIDIVVTERDGVQSNKGTIKLFANDGAIKGVDVKNIVDGAYSAYQQLSGNAPDDSAVESGSSEQSDETGFAELLGTNNDFTVNAPFFRISGAGDIDLAAQNLDYLLDIAIVKSTSGQGGQSIDELDGLTIPLRLSGALVAPNYSLDMKALYQSLAKAKVEEKKNEYIEEKLGISVDDDADGRISTKDILRGLIEKEVADEEEPQALEAEQQAEAAAAEQAPVAEQAPAAEQEPRELTDEEREDQLKDDLKNRLLDGLFN